MMATVWGEMAMTTEVFDRANFIRGKHTYGEIKIIGSGAVQTGKFCSIADGVTAVTVGHNTDWISTYPFGARQFRGNFPRAKAVEGHPTINDVVIGNDVWIGQGATLIAPCTIGHGAIIGAGSVVRGEVCPYTVFTGNPAKWRCNRFTPAQAKALLVIAWWDWSDKEINDNVHLLCSPDIQKFIDKELSDVRTKI
jgi:acetyltransferase-like isoleucine patch superfamily enzyme